MKMMLEAELQKTSLNIMFNMNLVWAQEKH